MPRRINPNETQAQAAERSAVSVSMLYKAGIVRRNGVPALGQAVSTGKISIHRALRISRLPEADQLAVLEGKKPLPKEVSPKVVGYIAGFDDAREAAAELAKAAGHRSLAAKIRRLRP